MKIAYTSDIHLNFLSYQRRLKLYTEIENLKADTLLIAGDIGESNGLVNYLTELQNHVTAPVCFVLGNHDFYKGSIQQTQQLADEYSALNWKKATYLSTQNYILDIDTRTAIIGHDGWADGRSGDYNNLSVELNDFYQIAELQNLTKEKRLEKMQELADIANAHIIKGLTNTIKGGAKNIIIVTHVPPWAKASRYRGRIANPDFLPYYCSMELGIKIEKAMKNQDANLTVICGHTHCPYAEQIGNIRVIVNGSDYNKPKVGIIECI